MPLQLDPPRAARSLLPAANALPGGRRLRRVLGTLLLGIAVCLTSACHAAAAPRLAAAGRPSMVTIFQDDPHVEANPVQTLAQMRLAGATVVKVVLHWYAIAPNPRQRRPPKGFNAVSPGSYPPGNWTVYDQIVRAAAADGIAVDFQLGDGAPLWATGPGAPVTKPFPNWEPSPSAFRAFVRAAGIRYSGRFRPKRGSPPLPRVSFWSVWNEPNLGFELAPQGVLGNLRIEHSGSLYRGLLNAAWTALHQTGHGHDTILIGELGPRGSNRFGVFAAMKPLIFMQALYCVDASYHQLRGLAAALRGCPTTAAGSRRFRAENPALFNASGLGVHLWARWYPPNIDPQHDPNYAGLPDLPHFQRAVDTILRAYGSHKRYDFYDTEFGYITNPPNHTRPFISPATASYYLNWAEYISWRNPRLRSFSQYLLQDPNPVRHRPYTFWSAGLFTYTGRPKVTYSAWRLPLYLPVTTTRRGRSLEVWGCVRPAQFAFADTGQPQAAQIQFARGSSGSYNTVSTVTIKSKTNCYFRVFLKFPSSGTVRLTWRYPPADPLLGNFPGPPAGPPSGTGNGSTQTNPPPYTDPLRAASDGATSATVYSRSVQITIK